MPVDIEDFEFAVYERFGQLLANGPRRSARTPRELATALAPAAPGLDSSVSVTARAFFRIRRCLADIAGIDVRSLNPATRCADLLPDLTTRRIVWAHFSQILRIRDAPHLHRP